MKFQTLLLKKYEEIMGKPKEHRNKWALGLAAGCTAVILLSFVFYKGYLSFGSGSAAKNQMASAITANSAPSPLDNAKQTFGAAFSEIGKKYQELKDSLANVFVPFITGIEVYNRK